MHRVMLGLSAAALIAGGQIVFGQGQGQAFGHDPFFDRADTGEIVHVLPTPASIHSPHDTQPTFASPSGDTAVFPASYGSGDLVNHGGPQIPNAAFLAIYWNASVANSTETSTLNGFHYGTIRDQVSACIRNFASGANWDNSATDDFTIVQQYGSHDAHREQPVSAHRFCRHETNDRHDQGLRDPELLEVALRRRHGHRRREYALRRLLPAGDEGLAAGDLVQFVLRIPQQLHL